MRSLFRGLLVLLLSGPTPAWAIDYQKIDRSLVKEPTYRSAKPLYALLLFGREARLRVWVVRDGESYYLDRDANGDLTGKDERFAKPTDCKGVTLADPDGKTTYVVTGLSGYEETKPVPRSALMVSVTVKGPVSYHQYCDVALADRPAKAGLAHFHGPLTAQPITVNWKVPPGVALKVGGPATDLRMLVGTLDEKAGCWTVVRSHEGERSAFPAGIHPQVTIEWPPATPGAERITQKATLKQFC